MLRHIPKISPLARNDIGSHRELIDGLPECLSGLGLVAPEPEPEFKVLVHNEVIHLGGRLLVGARR